MQAEVHWQAPHLITTRTVHDPVTDELLGKERTKGRSSGDAQTIQSVAMFRMLGELTAPSYNRRTRLCPLIPIEYHPDDSQLDHRDVVFDVLFVSSRNSAKLFEPADGSLDDVSQLVLFFVKPFVSCFV